MDVSQYLEIFIDESSEHIQTLSDCIMTLEQEPENKDTINEIFRAAHSLKGMAGTMGFKRMQHLTHDMENVFQEVRSDKIKVDSSMIDLLFKCLDAIDSYVENIKSTSDEGTDDNEVIIKELNDFIAKANGQTVSKQAEPQEKAAEAETKDSSDASDSALDTIELTNNEKNLIDEAISAGLKIYGMTVTVASDCLLKAARAFLVFKAVEELGQILVYRPSSQDIEDEKFDLSFSFYVASGEGFDKLEHAASNVSEIDKVEGKEITEFHLEGEAEQTAQAPEETKKADKEEKEEKTPAAKTESSKPKTANNSQKQAVSHKKATTSRTVRVDIEKLDMLMNQVSELIIAKNSLVAMSSSDGENNNNQSFHEQIEYLERITTNLHESVMKVRMVPIESVTQKYPRMIRDLSRTLNKKMNLVITGEDTELDRTVVDQIGDPLQHLLRNSADHGLESNEVRLERGKPEVGTIFLNAYQEGNNVVIKVGDDGNGIDTEAVKNKAIERGIVTAEQAENLSQKDIINFLFMPSFSMAKQITDISGRGVGLDVVKSGIEQLGGDFHKKMERINQGKGFFPLLNQSIGLSGHNMAVRKDFLYIFNSIPQNCLHDLWLQYCSGFLGVLRYLDEVLTLYRVHANNTSSPCVQAVKKNLLHRFREIWASSDDVFYIADLLKSFVQFSENYPDNPNRPLLIAYSRYFSWRADLLKLKYFQRMLKILQQPGRLLDHFRYGFGMRSLVRDLIVRPDIPQKQ